MSGFGFSLILNRDEDGPPRVLFGVRSKPEQLLFKTKSPFLNVSVYQTPFCNFSLYSLYVNVGHKCVGLVCHSRTDQCWPLGGQCIGGQ